MATSNTRVIYTIPAKQSNSGSIHDIESEHGDRIIRFGAGCKYAVVCASYYGGKGYTTHRTAEAVARACRRLGDYSHKVIDIEGREYYVERGYYAHDAKLIRA